MVKLKTTKINNTKIVVCVCSFPFNFPPSFTPLLPPPFLSLVYRVLFSFFSSFFFPFRHL